MAHREEEFYKDLDSRKRKGQGCSCRSLVIGFVVLGVLLGIIGTVIVKRILTINRPSTQVRPVGITANDLNARLKADATAHPNSPEVKLSLTSAELTGLLVNAQTPDWPVTDLQASINPNEVLLWGILTRPVRTSLTIHTFPEVVNGQFQLSITKIQAGTFAAPQFAVKNLNALIQKKLQEMIKSDQSDIALQRIELSNDVLTAVFTKQSATPAPKTKP